MQVDCNEFKHTNLVLQTSYAFAQIGECDSNACYRNSRKQVQTSGWRVAQKIGDASETRAGKVYVYVVIVLSKALEKLERAFEERDGLMHVIRADTNFEALRNDPRFQIILKKMRL